MQSAGRRRLNIGWFALLLSIHPMALTAAESPVISVIIDDLGDNWRAAQRAVELPGQLTYAILPQTPYAVQIAHLVHNRGKEVMLHQPMQSIYDKALGPGGLTLNMTQAEFLRILRNNLTALPHISGVNNHMGSLLTRNPRQMKWFMDELKDHQGLYLVDSRTTEESVMPALAREAGLKSVVDRDIFLDTRRHPDAIRKQFIRGLQRAKSNGSAILIAHPYPETLRILADLLPTLQREGVKLVPVSETVRYQKKKREQLWQASLSHSQKGAKSLKQ